MDMGGSWSVSIHRTYKTLSLFMVGFWVLLFLYYSKNKVVIIKFLTSMYKMETHEPYE